MVKESARYDNFMEKTQVKDDEYIATLDRHVEGDDLVERLDTFIDEGVTELYKGEAFPEKDKVLTANAYLGAQPIAAALAIQGPTLQPTRGCPL